MMAWQGLSSTLFFLGIVLVVGKIFYIISVIGNNGLMAKRPIDWITDGEVILIFFFLVLAVLGLTIHEFFYR